jgi:isopenicillin N synthase-like dioxygenase
MLVMDYENTFQKPVQIMTNGIYKSPVHRVMTNDKRERMTVAIFFTPDHTCEIKPAEGLVDDQNPKRYNSIIDYPSNYFQVSQQGRRLIDALKL